MKIITISKQTLRQRVSDQIRSLVPIIIKWPDNTPSFIITDRKTVNLSQNKGYGN